MFASDALPQQSSQKAEKLCRVLNGGFRAIVASTRHIGGEFFVRSCRNDLKSPLCLRLPLECGATVIAAHCATRALPWDGDHFQEFLQMRKDFQKFYGDLSALSHITHLKSLERLREEPERLLHGTDYPVVTAVFPSWLKGWIDKGTMQRVRA